jgi:hypothetical protein
VPTIQQMDASDGIVRANADSLMKLIGALDTAGIELIAEGRRHLGRRPRRTTEAAEGGWDTLSEKSFEADRQSRSVKVKAGPAPCSAGVLRRQARGLVADRLSGRACRDSLADAEKSSR